MPAEYGSVTPRVAAAATAASTALPPARSTSRPAAEASRSTVAIAPPVPVATGCLVGGAWPARTGAAVAARQRAATRAASRARTGRCIARTSDEAAHGLRSLVHPATFGQVCPSSDCLPLQQVVQGLLGLALGPGDQVVEAGALLAAGHGLGQGVLAAQVLARGQQVVQGRPRPALQPQPDGGQGGRLVGLQAVAVVELGQGQLGPGQQLPVGGVEVVGGLG